MIEVLTDRLLAWKLGSEELLLGAQTLGLVWVDACSCRISGKLLNLSVPDSTPVP